MRNGKPTIELTAHDGSNDQILRLEITIEDADEFDRIRRTVAKVLVDEWSGLGEQVSTSNTHYGINFKNPVMPNDNSDNS